MPCEPPPFAHEPHGRHRRRLRRPALRAALAAALAAAGLRTARGDLMEETDGKCLFMEGEFEENFDAPTLNASRWIPSSLNGLFHCDKGTAHFCTMATAANFVTNQSLPFYPTGNVTGAILTLTQDPCNNPFHRNLCCAPHDGEIVCANWTGAHAISAGCILYGTLTAEMGMKMPRGAQALWDFGTYVNGGVPDPTWNEIDMIFRMGMQNQGLETETVMTLPNGTNVTTGRYVASQMDTTFFNPGEHKESFDQATVPRFDGYIAKEYHNYTITWTPDYIAWQLDEVVFRNVNKAGRAAEEMRSPWRPQSIRLIFHTGNGSLHPLPAAHVYIKRIAYRPMPTTPLLQTKSGVYFVVSTVTWLAVYTVGMLMLGAGVRAVANNRHYAIFNREPEAPPGPPGPPGGGFAALGTPLAPLPLGKAPAATAKTALLGGARAPAARVTAQPKAPASAGGLKFSL